MIRVAKQIWSKNEQLTRTGPLNETTAAGTARMLRPLDRDRRKLEEHVRVIVLATFLLISHLIHVCSTKVLIRLLAHRAHQLVELLLLVWLWAGLHCEGCEMRGAVMGGDAGPEGRLNIRANSLEVHPGDKA